MTQQEWNIFVLENHGSFLQMWEWGTFQESSGSRVHRMRFEDTSGVFAVANALVLGLPFGQKCLAIHHGPVTRGEMSDEQNSIIMQGIRRAAIESGACVIRVDALEKSVADMLEKQGFRARRSAQPNVTSMVDLTQSEEALLAAMHSKTRYNIRVAEKHNVTVRRADHSSPDFARDTELFLKLFAQTTQRDKFSGHHAEYYRRMLRAVVSEQIVAELYLAERKNEQGESEALAGAIIAHYDETGVYLHGASSNTGRQYMAPYALHWQAMRDTKKLGGLRYDFWGIAPDDNPAHPWAGITRFKKGFGGSTMVHAGGWELPMPGFWGAVYRLIKK